jgi:excisionase family DNA binding protein
VTPPPAAPTLRSAPIGQLLTVNETAARLVVSRRTVQGWLAAGRLTPIRLGTRTLRIAESEVEAFVRRGMGIDDVR